MSLDAEAFRYAANGHLIFPVEARGTRPIYEDWQRSATCDLYEVSRWWHRHPDANIGMLTGKRADMDVVEIDVYGGGLRDFYMIEDQNDLCPDKLYVRAPQGKLHVYLRWADAEQLRAVVEKMPDTVRLLGEGRHVLLPPSIDRQSNTYQWANEFMRESIAS